MTTTFFAVHNASDNTRGIADIEFFFGDPEDVPLVGASDGKVYLRNSNTPGI